MSFHNSRSSKPTRRSGSLRNNSHNTAPGLASYNRPRSLSFLSSASNPYSTYTPSPTSASFHSFIPGVPTSALLNNYNYSSYNPYSKSGYSSPYSNGYTNGYTNGYSNSYTPNNHSHTTYGGLSSGYGSLSVPSKMLSALNIMPYTTKTYDKSNRDYLQSVSNNTMANAMNHKSDSKESKNEKKRRSRSSTRDGSFVRSRSQSAVRESGMGSRSVSLTSLNSEGYASGSESKSSSRGSRLGSASDLSVLRGENGELDYKKMYEQAVADNDRLREKLRKSDEDLRETKQTLEKLNTVTSKNSLSELEKRERRAMERKLSEMEEELKQLQKLKAENERLRAENRALTRVVSKLTNSAGK